MSLQLNSGSADLCLSLERPLRLDPIEVSDEKSSSDESLWRDIAVDFRRVAEDFGKPFSTTRTGPLKRLSSCSRFSRLCSRGSRADCCRTYDKDLRYPPFLRSCIGISPGGRALGGRRVSAKNAGTGCQISTRFITICDRGSRGGSMKSTFSIGISFVLSTSGRSPCTTGCGSIERRWLPGCLENDTSHCGK